MHKQVDNVNQTGPASRDCSADAVIDLVHTVMHQFRSCQYQLLRGEAHDITHMESKVLAFFSQCPGATLTDLVTESGRDKAQLARLVKGLRERKLLTGEPGSTDKRNVQIRLSDAGRLVHTSLHAVTRAMNERAVEGLSAKQRAQLVELLGQLKENLDGAKADN